MPDRHSLQLGDLIRIVRVPAMDLTAMADAMRHGKPHPQWTVRVFQRLADRQHQVRIDQLDDHNTPWFSYSFKNKSNTWEHHHLAVMDDDSWELATHPTRAATGKSS